MEGAVTIASARGGGMEFTRSVNSEGKNRQGWRFLTAQGIEAEILVARLAGQQDWSGKPGFLRRSRKKCALKFLCMEDLS
jgi:hypothetical protein